MLFQNKLEKIPRAAAEAAAALILQWCNVFSSSRCLLSICHFIKNANVFKKEDDLVTPWFAGPNPLRVTGYKQEYCTK